MILNAIKAIKMDPDEVENLVLAIFSDMQYDNNFREADRKNIFAYLSEEYKKAGMEIFNRPYKLPHILFWNMRTTTGFPTVSDEENVSMLSGNSPVLLNNFEANGINAVKNLTPWNMLKEQLNRDRYNILTEHLV